jgi:hypothetical protein
MQVRNASKYIRTLWWFAGIRIVSARTNLTAQCVPSEKMAPVVSFSVTQRLVTRKPGGQQRTMLSNFGSLFNKTKDILKQVEEKTKGAIANATHSGAPASATSDVAVSHSQPGGDVIARHEKAWARVLQNNAKMATQFAATEEKVVKLAEGSDVKHMQFKELERELGSLDEVSKAVEALQKEMTGMCAELKGLDDALDGHISEREERDLARWQLAAETDTERMEAQRRADLVQAEKQIKVDRERRNRARKAEDERILREIEAKEAAERRAAEAEARRVAQAEAHARAEEERKKKDEERAAALEKAKAEKAQADAEALVAKAEKAKAEAEALAEQAAKAKAALEAAKTKEPPQDAVVE